MTGDYGISASNRGKGIQAFVCRRYRLLTLAVVLVLLGTGIGLWVSLPASSTHPPIRAYSGKQFPPPVLSYPSPKKLDRQIAKITPPWKTMTSAERSSVIGKFDINRAADGWLNINGNAVSADLYYSTPLCTPSDMKITIHYPFTEVNIGNVSHHACNILNLVQYGTWLDCSSILRKRCSAPLYLPCLAAVIVYSSSGTLVKTFPSQNYVDIIDCASRSRCGTRSTCRGPYGILIKPRQSFSDMLINHFSPSMLPSGTYTAEAVVPIGYLPLVQCSFTAQEVQSCPAYKVYLYYSKPVTFTIK